MNFLDELKERKKSVELKEINITPKALALRDFDLLEYGNFAINVRADFGSYCTPRETLEKLNKYKEMEFAIVRGKKFLTVTDVLPTFTKLQEIEKYNSKVYGYVPVDLIQELYEELNRVYR
jgi:hypothetical protein